MTTKSSVVKEEDLTAALELSLKRRMSTARKNNTPGALKRGFHGFEIHYNRGIHSRIGVLYFLYFLIFFS